MSDVYLLKFENNLVFNTNQGKKIQLAFQIVFTEEVSRTKSTSWKGIFKPDMHSCAKSYLKEINQSFVVDFHSEVEENSLLI